MNDLASDSLFTLVLTAGALIIIPMIIIQSSKRRRDENDGIPLAPGSIPLLGHALEYKKDPGNFLRASSEAVGDIFKINLAGKRMVVVSGIRKQRMVAMAPESVLSARQAVADIGFEHMLGPLNVHKGTDLHKGIVKGIWHDDADGHVRLLVQSIQRSLDRESKIFHTGMKDVVDFMQFVRRVILRTTIDRFIGSFFIDDSWDLDFIDVFMKFQDDLEDVTAKSVLLPRSVALPLLLRPLARRRQKLQEIIAQRLRNTEPHPSEASGFWLDAIRDSYSFDDIAQLIVGLLFAAHKNPAIGAAQSYLMLVEKGSPEEKDLCMREAQILLGNPSYQAVDELCPILQRLCLESLRLTAHAIGGLRTAQQNFDVGKNQVIAKGSTVALTHISSSIDSNIWKEPRRFILNPKSKSRSKELYDNEYTFSVFSHGIHKCPGQKLAMIMLQCTVALLLEHYDIQFAKPLPPIDFERATLAQRGGPVAFTIAKRTRGS